MKIKHVIWVLVLNVFLMLAMSVLLEYNDLSNRLQQLENNIQTCFETAVDTSMASEELFTEKFTQHIYSVSGSLNGGNNLSAASQIRVYRRNTWVTGNAYIMSFFYQDNGRFPNTQSEYNSYASSGYDDEDAVFERLFGKVGQVYNSSSLAWSSTNQSTKNQLVGVSSDRTPNAEFKAFYDSIGKTMLTTAPVKVKTGTGVGDFKVENRTFPTLTQMGLVLDNTINGTGNTYMSDNFCMSFHVGKKILGGVKSKYYLTPYSLGVTYVPTEVLKPLFLSHLEQQIRFTKIKGDSLQDATFSGDLGTANGCIPTSIYQAGASEPILHEYMVPGASYLGNTSYINDGYTEYDMDSVQVRVDYFNVNFYEEGNAKVVNKILGAVSGFNIDGSLKSSYDMKDIVHTLEASDTGKNYNGVGTGNRLVARVTVKMRVQIPYKSSILQWFAYMSSSHTSNNHFGIRGWNPAANNYDANSDGVWYQYTTYRAVSR